MDLKGFFRYVLNREPKNSSEWIARGDHQLGRDNLDEALLSYRSALGLEPENLQALRGAAIASRRMGDLEAAKGMYFRILTLVPDDGQTLLALGYVHSVDGNAEMAVQCFDRVLEKEPRNLTANALKYFVLSEVRPVEERLNLVREIEAVDPGFFNRLAQETAKEMIVANILGFPQGDRLLLTGDTPYKTRDIRALEEALPRIIQAASQMLRDFSPDGAVDLTDSDGADNLPDPDFLFRTDTEELEKIRKRQPLTDRGWFEKGDQLCRSADNGLNLGDETRQELYQEAGLCFERLCSISPQKELVAMGWLGRGYAAMRLAQYPEALTYFDEAARIVPDDVACLKGKAHALSNLGRAEEAARCFEKVQKIQDITDPHHALWMTSRLKGYIISKLSS